jgi:Na+/proline symporter
MYMGIEVNIDQVYGLMAHDLLPQIAPGLVGLFIASMLAAVMSSCDAFMVTSAALFTENIYKPLIVKDREDKHYMIAGRIVSVAVVLAGILFAYLFEDIVEALEVFWKVSAMMGIAFFAGLFWRRATTAGALAATITSFTALLFTSTIKMFGFVLWDFNARFASKLPEFMLYEGELALHWQMILYLSLGLIVIIVTSLLTKPEEKQKLDKFYECLRTPIGPDEPETKPFTLPEGVEPAPRRPWIEIPGFEIPKPAMVTVIGFFAGWAAVGILIWSFFWILSR